MRGKRANIYLPGTLKAQLELIGDAINVSAVCVQALQAEVAKYDIPSLLRERASENLRAAGVEMADHET